MLAENLLKVIVLACWGSNKWKSSALRQSMTVASMFSMLIFKTIPAFAHVRLRACYGRGQPHNNATLGLNLFHITVAELLEMKSAV